MCGRSDSTACGPILERTESDLTSRGTRRHSDSRFQRGSVFRGSTDHGRFTPMARVPVRQFRTMATEAGTPSRPPKVLRVTRANPVPASSINADEQKILATNLRLKNKIERLKKKLRLADEGLLKKEVSIAVLQVELESAKADHADTSKLLKNAVAEIHRLREKIEDINYSTPYNGPPTSSEPDDRPGGSQTRDSLAILIKNGGGRHVTAPPRKKKRI